MPAHWPVAPLFAAAALLFGCRRDALARQWLLDAYLYAAWSAIVTACILSSAERLESTTAWTAAGAIALVSAGLSRARIPRTGETHPDLPEAPADRTARGVLLSLALGAAVAVASNLVLMFGTAPGSWDSLAYHLPRMALSLQRHAFDIGPTNFWAQEAHPIGSTAMLVLTSVASGHDEHAVAAWQMIGWLVATLAVFGIARDLAASRPAAAFAALLFAILPQTITQAPTSGNDMVLAAATGIAAQALLAYLRHGRGRDAARLAAACALGLAIKLSFVSQVVMLASIPVALIVMSPRDRTRRSMRLVTGAALAMILSLVIALPAGYISNLRRWGSLVGPPAAVEAHTFAGQTPGQRAANGMRNVVRLSTDFISLDGMPRVTPVLRAQSWIRRGVMTLVGWPPLGIASSSGVRASFLPDRPVFAAESHAFWGIAGLLLLWPSAFMALAGGAADRRAVAVAALVFLAAQAFSGPYDPFRGRYFLSAAVLVAPLTSGWLARRGPWARGYLTAAVALTVFSAFGAALFRTGAPIVQARARGAVYESVLSQDRAAQLTRQRPVYAPVLRRYEDLVPADAIVADMLPPDSFEYMLWGPRLGRTVLPVDGRTPGDAAFARAGFLVFTADRLAPREGDVLLGEDWWLRTLPTGSATTTAGR